VKRWWTAVSFAASHLPTWTSLVWTHAKVWECALSREADTGHHGARPATAAPATASSRMDVNFLEFTRALIGAATRMIDGFQQKAIDPCLWEWNIVRIPLGDAYYDLEISPNVQRGRELYALGTKAGGEFFARRLLALGLIDVASALEGGADRTRTASSTGTPKVKVE
jgi:hypothetical protein